MLRTHRIRPATVMVAGVSALAAVLTIGFPVAAHDGRGPGGVGSGLLHPLLGLDHLLAMVAVGVLAVTAGSRRVTWATPAAFVVGMVLGGVVGLMTGGIGVIEVLIAASVMLLGALVVAGRTGSGPVTLAVAATVGAVHGHAHGAELPSGAMPLAYVAGFVVATAALHLAGIAIGLVIRDRRLVRVAAGSFLAAAGALILTAA